MTKFSKQDHALANLGKVHAYASWLEKQGLLEEGVAGAMCRKYYDDHKEIAMSYGEAMSEAVRRRDQAFAEARAKLRGE